jgi:hypothetical protein
MKLNFRKACNKNYLTLNANYSFNIRKLDLEIFELKYRKSFLTEKLRGFSFIHLSQGPVS